MHSFEVHSNERAFKKTSVLVWNKYVGKLKVDKDKVHFYMHIKYNKVVLVICH